jgi:excisionase family DNA binding protein
MDAVLANGCPAASCGISRISKLLFTVPAAAGVLSLSESRVWELLASGELRGVKIRRSRRITRAALDEYVASLEAEVDA